MAPHNRPAMRFYFDLTIPEIKPQIALHKGLQCFGIYFRVCLVIRIFWPQHVNKPWHHWSRRKKTLNDTRQDLQLSGTKKKNASLNWLVCILVIELYNKEGISEWKKCSQDGANWMVHNGYFRFCSIVFWSFSIEQFCWIFSLVLSAIKTTVPLFIQ